MCDKVISNLKNQMTRAYRSIARGDRVEIDSICHKEVYDMTIIVKKKPIWRLNGKAQTICY